MAIARTVLLGPRLWSFSVSHSHVHQVAAYIANQDEHHRKKSFRQEFELFVKRYGLEWHDDHETV